MKMLDIRGAIAGRVLVVCIGVGAAFALATATAAEATPGSLGFGKCVPVAEGTGAFGNSACTKPGKLRKFEWVPLSESISITTSLAPKTGQPLFEEVEGIQMPCKGESGSTGAIGASEISGLSYRMSGCETFAECNSPGDPAGVVETLALEGAPGIIQKNGEGKEEKDVVGVDLEGAGSEFTSFDCGPDPVPVRGSVIGKYPVNKMLASIKVEYRQEKGKQLPEGFVGGAPDFLEWEFGLSGKYTQLGLSFVAKWSTVSKAKVELRHCEANVC